MAENAGAADSGPRNKRIRNALLLWESFDTLDLISQAARHSPDTAAWFIRPDWHLLLERAPQGMRLPGLRARFFTKRYRLFYLFYPAYLVYEILSVFFFFLWLRLGRRIRLGNVVTTNPYHGLGLALMRRLGLVDRLVFMAGDWFANALDRRGLWSRFGQKAFHPWCERFLVSTADCTFNLTRETSELRTRYWGKQVARRERLMEPTLTWRALAEEPPHGRHTWLFFGTARADSGLEYLIEALAMEGPETRLRFIGPENAVRAHILELAQKRGVMPRIEVVGFADRAAFPELTRDCLFGANLITTAENFSANALPGKIMDYLQLGLPVLCTANVGFIAETIAEKRLGAVIAPSAEAIRDAAARFRSGYADYRASIKAYVDGRKSSPLLEELR